MGQALGYIRETTQMGPPSVFSPENRYATLEILRQFLSLWQVEQDERKAGIRIPEDRSAFARAWARWSRWLESEASLERGDDITAFR